MLDPRARSLRWSRVASVVIGLMLVVGVSGEASAQATPAEIEGAKAAFFRALDLEVESDWEGALKELSAVAKVKTTPQVLFHIGLCQENLGRLILARESFTKALTQARSEGDAAAEVLENAPTRISALDERVPTLRIDQPEKNEDLRVWVNGTEVEPGEMGKAIPRDPGRVRIEKDTGGARTLVREFVLTEGTHHVESIALALAKPAGPLVPEIQKEPAPLEQTGDIGAKIPAIVVGSVGIASAIASATCFGLSLDIQSEVESHCSNPDAGTGCDPEYEELSGDGERLRAAGIALAAISGATLATGVVLWFVLPDGAAKPSQSLASAPRVGLDVSSRFVGVRGAF